MGEIAGFRIGDVELTRVPYFDVALDPAVVSLTPAEIAAVDWAEPTWANADQQVLLGVAVWVIVSKEQLIVVDPCGAADEFLRSGPAAITHQEAVLAALRDAGFPPERVDLVVLSHLDGIGMVAVVEPDGSWAPAFPNARIVITAAELEYLTTAEEGSLAARTAGLGALQQLVAAGVVDGVDDGYAVTDEVRLEVTGGHTPGHALIHVESGPDRATFVGHLALTPLHFVTAERKTAHVDARVATARLAALGADAAEHRALVIGPLWPFPGAGYVDPDDHRIVPA